MSVLALVSRAVFEKALASPGIGDVWPVATYSSSNAALEPLRHGGALYLVTVRPGDELWLVAVLRAPRKDRSGWTAKANTVPIVKATAGVMKKVRFSTGKGLSVEPGKLAMSLQTPRQLTEDDVALFEGLVAPSRRGTRSKPSPGAREERSATRKAEQEVPVRGTSSSTATSPWARRIIEMLELPAGLEHAPLTGTWRGPLKHIGPDKFTPLKQSLLDKTNSAIYSLLSGVLLWGAERLRATADVSPLEDLALALFCFQQDARYLRRPAKIAGIDEIEARPRSEATVLYLLDTVYQDQIYERGTWSDLPMWGTAAEAINLVRFNLPPSAVARFDRWLARLIDRLDALAPFADPGEAPRFATNQGPASRAWRQSVMGRALPPSVLDLRLEPKPETFAAEWRAFLRTLDWESSVHLRPPKELAKAGFEGTPYHQPRA